MGLLIENMLGICMHACCGVQDEGEGPKEGSARNPALWDGIIVLARYREPL